MKQFFLTLFAVVCAVASSGQSLEECRRLAREHYPEIRQYDLISQTEQYNLSNASRAWIPQLALSAQATYQSATPTYPEAFNTILQANGVEMAGIRRDQYKVALDVSQNIWAYRSCRRVYAKESAREAQVGGNAAKPDL